VQRGLLDGNEHVTEDHNNYFNLDIEQAYLTADNRISERGLVPTRWLFNSLCASGPALL